MDIVGSSIETESPEGLSFNSTFGEIKNRFRVRDLKRGENLPFISDRGFNSLNAKFSFVRNPFDWVVSLYEFIRTNETHENYNEVKDMDFEEFSQTLDK